MKAYIMEKVRKLRRMVSEENPIKKNIDFLKVVGHENYRHSMDSLDKASEKLNKTCMEAKQIIEENHGCEITCNFCGEKYYFTEEELIDLERFLELHEKK